MRCVRQSGPEQIIENKGSIALIASGANRSYSARANAAGSSPLPITKDGAQIYAGIYGPDWTVLAADTINGVNQLLWKNSAANRLHLWSLDASWSWISSSLWDEPSSTVGQQLEAQFALDLDGDGVISAAGGNRITSSATFQASIANKEEVHRYPIDVLTGSIIGASLTSSNDSLYPLIDLRDPSGSLLKGSIAYNGNSADLGMYDLITGRH